MCPSTTYYSSLELYELLDFTFTVFKALGTNKVHKFEWHNYAMYDILSCTMFPVGLAYPAASKRLFTHFISTLLVNSEALHQQLRVKAKPCDRPCNL